VKGKPTGGSLGKGSLNTNSSQLNPVPQRCHSASAGCLLLSPRFNSMHQMCSRECHPTVLHKSQNPHSQVKWLPSCMSERHSVWKKLASRAPNAYTAGAHGQQHSHVGVLRSSAGTTANPVHTATPSDASPTSTHPQQQPFLRQGVSFILLARQDMQWPP
jgi:hypothetical protein